MSGKVPAEQREPWSEVFLMACAVPLIAYGFYLAPLQQLLHRPEEWWLSSLCVFSAFGLMFLAQWMKRDRLRRR